MCTRLWKRSKTYTIQDIGATSAQNGIGRKPKLQRPHSFYPPGQEPDKVNSPPDISQIQNGEQEVQKPIESVIEVQETVVTEVQKPATTKIQAPVIPEIEEPVVTEVQKTVKVDINEETSSHKTEVERPSTDFSVASKSSFDNEPPAEIKIDDGVERRPGVIPLPANIEEAMDDEIEKHPKSPEDDRLIRDAIEKNEFINRIIKGDLLQQVVDAMYKREIKAKEVIIKEGATGSHMYVSAKGRYEVSVKGKGIVNTFDDVRIFGELAILYNAKRNATIRAVKAGQVWVLDRKVYQKLTVRSNIKEHDEMVEFLQKVPTLNQVGTAALQKVATLLKVEFFSPGTPIVTQGHKGDKFYIIRAGTVTITKEGEGVVGHLNKGKYFGELALLKEDVRQATVTADSQADSQGVECWTLQRQDFIEHFGELKDLGTLQLPKKTEPKVSVKIKEHQDIELNDLTIITTLGVGGFGRVELVQHKTKNLIFALKYLKKIDMVEQNQQDHVYNERNIQTECRSKFIVRLYRSYRDAKYIYFLMESCLGGDLWTLLQRQKNRRFEEKDSRFIAACVLEAFNYLHDRGIVYRDLKPENLLIDEHGYIKLTDFGFAKNLGSRGRTFTFAGTPEYVAPEIILSKGHDKAVDYWAFGIFIFELLTGRTPFRTNDASHMRTYNKILMGIDSVDFPSYVTPKARHIIEKLCKAIPTERLGCQRNGIKDIKSHKWFLGFDWERLNAGKLPAPFKPKLRSNTDTRYFEVFKKDNDIPPDENSGWDLKL